MTRSRPRWTPWIGSQEGGETGRNFLGRRRRTSHPVLSEVHDPSRPSRLPVNPKMRGVTSNKEAASSIGDDANLLMLIQIPLKYRQPRVHAAARYEAAGAAMMMNADGPPMPAAAPEPEAQRARSSPRCRDRRAWPRRRDG